MATNTLLTPTTITREALRILHSKLNFVGNINRQYDDKFASSGGKIGNTLNVRLPAKYKARKTATYSAQNYVERSTPIVMASQYGVDVSFTSVELTLSLEDFSKRVLQPAVSQLAAEIEGDALAAAFKNVANFVGTTSTTMTYKQLAQGGQVLSEQLAGTDSRIALLNPLSRVEFADAVKAFHNPDGDIAKLYREGIIGRASGFDVYENTLIGSHTAGTLGGTPLTTGAALGVSATTHSWARTADITIDGATSGTTVKAGDVLTFGTLAAGFVDCHPETKASYGKLKKFVATGDVTVVTAGTATVTVSPAPIYGSGNGYQNCINTKADTDNMTVTLWSAASANFGQNLQFHPDAFTAVFADLEDVSKYGSWGSRQTMDGISMRTARQYVLADDAFPCRIDVLWGFAPLYPELAVKSIHTL
jgi:P22 coat protein - gene protein 5.